MISFIFFIPFIFSLSLQLNINRAEESIIMSKINEALVPVLESAIKKSLKNFESVNKGNSLSDLYMRFDSENAILSVFDDMENKLTEINLEKQEDFSEDFETQLKETSLVVLQRLEKEHLFDKEYIFKPFTVSMVDDDFIVSDELIFIDDDTLKIDGDLLTNLDKELDDFLKNLMK